MTMTDPIADMLTRLRNANQAYHDSTSMPHSKIKVGIAEILKQQGYITSYEVIEPAEGEVGKTLKITLKYGRTASVRSRACAASASPACACTPRATRCRRCSAASASRSSRRRRAC
jgi:ribosomal protein S8